MIKSMRIAIVGTGPAGMYALEHLLENNELKVEIDLYEKLPVPWGLVRYGVAPDHPEKKRVADRLFSYFIGRNNVRFMGNVEVGKEVHHSDLGEWYDAVIYAVGTDSDIQMGIPGEELSGSWAARKFVAWYNGHPEFSNLTFDLSCKRAVIVGNGNVALDVARILTLPTTELEKTDIADYALDALRSSQIQEVVIMGRRGQVQGAFHNPELEELEDIEGVEVAVEGEDFPVANEAILDNSDWESRRKIATLSKLVNRKVSNPKKRIVFRFLSSPVKLVGKDRVAQLRVVRNQLAIGENGRLVARATQEEDLIETGLVLRATGYRGRPLPGVPFDERRGVIENDHGRVTDRGTHLQGTYVTGWIKRGPQGIIGTNKQCAKETIDALITDAVSNQLARSGTLTADEVVATLQLRKPDFVSLRGWRRIDNFERSQGRAYNRPRVKLHSIPQMLEQVGS